MSKIILHIDLNAFFVRCEELKNPSLIGKPVIIGHLGRGGIVSTCSYAAREFGVRSGMPTYKAVGLCPKAILLDGDFQFYDNKSLEFINFVKRHSNIVEQVSIDECFVDMTSILKNETKPLNYIKKIQTSLLKETGLKCSIGVAATKFLAKMASDLKKPMGITILRKRDVEKVLYPLPIGDFFGIGKKTAPRLEEQGIKTIGDLANFINNDEYTAKNVFGKMFYYVKSCLDGDSDDIVSTNPFDPKSLGHSITFKVDTTDIEDIKDYLKTLSSKVSNEAKESGKKGKKVQLVLKDNEFKTINRSKKLNDLTNEFKDIYNTAVQLLIKNYDGRPIRLAGVTLQDLVDPHDQIIQMSIFDNFDEIKEECATKILISELNKRMNKSVFKTAGDHLREIKNGTK